VLLLARKARKAREAGEYLTHIYRSQKSHFIDDKTLSKQDMTDYK
jgi:hypothetical protein